MTVIYMPLLDEGTEVWRPVEATPLGHEKYRVMDKMPEDEVWAFPPGSIVRCEKGESGVGRDGYHVVGFAD